MWVLSAILYIKREQPVILRSDVVKYGFICNIPKVELVRQCLLGDGVCFVFSLKMLSSQQKIKNLQFINASVVSGSWLKVGRTSDRSLGAKNWSQGSKSVHCPFFCPPLSLLQLSSHSWSLMIASWLGPLARSHYDFSFWGSLSKSFYTSRIRQSSHPLTWLYHSLNDSGSLLIHCPMQNHSAVDGRETQACPLLWVSVQGPIASS